MNMMRVIFTRTILLCLTFFTIATASAAVHFDKQKLEQRFEKLGIAVNNIVPSSDIDGLLEVQTSNGTLFSSPSGEFFIAGTLYKLDHEGKYEDVIAKRMAPIHAKQIAKMRDHMIEYKAQPEKYAVTVFTDITCGYCVRLHSQLKAYNDLGITVRYLAFPRQGTSGPVAKQMAAIWCSDNPQKSLDAAKLERKQLAVDKNSSKCQTLVTNQYDLGKALGVKGTPAIFLPNGEMVGGYLPPQELLKRLESI
jgi:thiol:disulfide interchange protein DsbC